MAQENPEGEVKSPPPLPPRIGLTLAGTGYFARPFSAQGGGAVIRPPPRVWPLIELKLRGKNERVGLYEERKPMVPDFNVSGQPMTTEVRLNTRRGPSERDALKSTVMNNSVLNWAKTLQNTP